MKYIYVAKGTVNSNLFGNPKLEVRSWRYEYLVKDMAEAVQDLRYYTEGVNSYKKSEAYTKDLIWPEVSWKITREQVK